MKTPLVGDGTEMSQRLTERAHGHGLALHPTLPNGSYFATKTLLDVVSIFESKTVGFCVKPPRRRPSFRRPYVVAAGGAGARIARVLHPDGRAVGVVLLLNALVGKFGEKRQGDELLSIERAARVEGMTGVGGILARSEHTREGLHAARAVGNLCVIEWASLIVGRARALMTEIIARGAHHVSTDAVIVPDDLSIDCESALRAVGSDMTMECVGDAVFFGRTRQYVLLKRVENLTPDTKVIARNDSWAVVKVARHGAAESEKEFAEMVLRCLDTGRDQAVPVARTQLMSAKSVVRESRPGKPLRMHQELERTGTTSFDWDGKRRILDRDINPFRSFSDTAPNLSVDTCEGGEHQREVISGEARRKRRSISKRRQAEIVTMLYAGVSIRKIETATGVPRSTIADLKKALELGVVPVPSNPVAEDDPDCPDRHI